MITQFQNFIQILANKNGTLKTLKNKENHYDNLKRKKTKRTGEKTLSSCIVLFSSVYDYFLATVKRR